MEAADFLALNVKCLMQGATWRMSDFDFFPFQEARLSCGKNIFQIQLKPALTTSSRGTVSAEPGNKAEILKAFRPALGSRNIRGPYP